MRILVTGSEGNIGTSLVPYLKESGHELYCVDIKQKFKEGYILSDITNPIELWGIFEEFRPDIVYHMAAMVSRITCEKSPALCVTTNITGTNNILQLCKKFGSKFIYFSTSEVYGNIQGKLSEDRKDLQPNNLYGLTKYLGEKLVEYEVYNNGLKAIIVRPFMFYDPNETLGEHRSAMIRFAEGLIKGEKIEVHKNSERSWMRMKDAIIILERLAHVDTFQIVNIGNPDVIRTEDLAKKMCLYLGLNYKDHVIETELPGRMTLKKYPDLNNQKLLTGHTGEFNIEDGIREIIERVRRRIGNEA